MIERVVDLWILVGLWERFGNVLLRTCGGFQAAEAVPSYGWGQLLSCLGWERIDMRSMELVKE